MQTQFILPSTETGTSYVIQAVTPDPQVNPGPWIAVLFMDGDDQFTAAVDAYEKLRADNAVSPLLLVGVGYGAGYRGKTNRRGRDYTPTAHADEPSSGGGEVFLRFLTETLWPAIEKRYPVRNDVRGLAGHSLGSLLAVSALTLDPLFFTHILASAPSIWWDNRSVLRLLAERRMRNPKMPAVLFLSVGENDTESMTGDLTLLEQDLAQRPFLQLTVLKKRFPNCDHYNVVGDAFSAGLNALFAQPSPVSKSS